MPDPATGHLVTRRAAGDHVEVFAHNVRNALAASLGRIELLERRLRLNPLADDDTLESLAVAANQIRRADALVTSFETSWADRGHANSAMGNGRRGDGTRRYRNDISDVARSDERRIS